MSIILNANGQAFDTNAARRDVALIGADGSVLPKAAQAWAMSGVTGDTASTYAAVLEAIRCRIAVAPNANQSRTLESELRGWNAAMISTLSKLSVDCGAMVRAFAGDGAKPLAVYAMEKVRQIASALTQANRNLLDRYTEPMLINAAHNANALRNKAALVTLSREVTYTETEQQQSIIARHRCAPSTASTQASSSRMALRAIGACRYDERDRSMSLTDAPVTRALLALVGQ